MCSIQVFQRTLIVFSVIEVGRVVLAILYIDDPNYEAIFKAFMSPFIIFAAFGSRLVYLSIKDITLLGNALTFWLCVTFLYIAFSYALYGCILNCESRAGSGLYSLFTSFPLETLGAIFVFFGSLKFVFIAIWALLSKDEQNFDS